MQLIKQQCTGCGYCVLVCPYDALKTDGWAKVIPANCTDCNLCVYACPSDCFVPEPETPLKPYRPQIDSTYDIIIIGSGIGGLIAGVALAQANFSVVVFEKLGFPGGRYTELDYKGAAVTTGAWTNLGPKSHIGRMLIELGIDLSYISIADADLPEQYSIRFPDGRRYHSLLDLLTPAARKAWLKAILTGKRQLNEQLTINNEQLPITNYQLPTHRANVTNPQSPIPNLQSPIPNPLTQTATADYLSEFSDDPDLLAAVESIAATTSGVSSALMPASEYIQITLDARQAGRDFAMPRGGVRAIIKALTKALRQAGGRLFVRTPVEQILIEKGVATGVRLAAGRQIRSRIVLHNGGPSRFVKLVGSNNLPQAYLDKLAGLQGVECAALFCATREPLFVEAPMTMTPNCERVVGIFTPTLLDPAMSKEGLYLYDAFFPTGSDNRAAELELALADLRALFPRFDEVLEWYVPMFFTGSWPGTESGQIIGQTGGQRLDPATPIENCFLVGMDVKGSGVAGDLIPLGVRRVLEYLKEANL